MCIVQADTLLNYQHIAKAHNLLLMALCDTITLYLVDHWYTFYIDIFLSPSSGDSRHGQTSHLIQTIIISNSPSFISFNDVLAWYFRLVKMNYRIIPSNHPQGHLIFKTFFSSSTTINWIISINYAMFYWKKMKFDKTRNYLQ